MGEQHHRRRILLVHGGALGDLVLAVMLTIRLREAPGPAAVHALCRSRIAGFLTRQRLIAGWRSLEAPDALALFSATEGCAGHLQQYCASFDLVISMLGDGRGSVARRVQEFAESRACHIDPGLRGETERSGRHIVQQWLADLQLQQPGLMFEPYPSPVATGHRDTDSGGGVVVIHPGSGSMSKCWPLDRFMQLAVCLQQEGRQVRFMIGPAEMERFGTDWELRLGRVAPVICEQDVCRAAECLLGAARFIGNDSGFSHLAACLGIPTLAIFTSTSPAVWRPLGRSVLTLRDPDLDEVLAASSTRISVERG